VIDTVRHLTLIKPTDKNYYPIRANDSSLSH